MVAYADLLVLTVIPPGGMLLMLHVFIINCASFLFIRNILHYFLYLVSDETYAHAGNILLFLGMIEQV